MTEADRVQIKSLWDNGLPIEQIVRMLPYKQSKAREIISSLRADGTLPPRNRVDISVTKIAEAYKNGITDINKLATMFNYNPSTIIIYLERAHIKRGRPKNYKTSLGYTAMAIMQELNRGNMTQAEISTAYGVSRQYVNQLKRRLKEKNVSIEDNSYV